MDLKFQVKDTYGSVKFYPLCKVSRAIVEITRRKTLSLDEVKKLRKAGFLVRTEINESIRSEPLKVIESWEHA